MSTVVGSVHMRQKSVYETRVYSVMHYLGDEECANLWLQKARTTLPWKPEFKREPGE